MYQHICILPMNTSTKRKPNDKRDDDEGGGGTLMIEKDARGRLKRPSVTLEEVVLQLLMTLIPTFLGVT